MLDDVGEGWRGEIADRDPALYDIIDAAGLAHGASKPGDCRPRFRTRRLLSPDTEQHRSASSHT